MYFMIACWDKPGREALRAQTRAAHLDYLGRFEGEVLGIGPIQSDDGEKALGSLLIMDFADRDAAEAFAAGDPYAKAGLFESVVIRRWKKVLPAD
ncbi:MAG: YciI family protein [Rhodospirillales bacterium]|nr:YciI family protein [Rhodospirillales bacterium]